MSENPWADLPGIEKAFMINAFEIDILPGVWGDFDDADQARPHGEIAAVLLALVDRGWVEVRRIAPWVSPTGQNGYTAGELVPRDSLVTVLQSEANWEYPENGDWIGALTLVETDAGRRITRRPAGTEDR